MYAPEQSTACWVPVMAVLLCTGLAITLDDPRIWRAIMRLIRWKWKGRHGT